MKAGAHVMMADDPLKVAAGISADLVMAAIWITG